MNRRSFMKLTSLGAVLPLPIPLAYSAPGATKNAVGGKTVRIAAIQTRKNPKIEGLYTDPFQSDFSLQDLYRSVDLWLEWYEELIVQAARESCRLAVFTEDFTRIFNLSMYLEDRSLFRKAVERQTSLVPERMGALARHHSMYLVACYFAAEGDLIRNVCDLFSPEGSLAGRYRKVHMPQYEKWQVTPGGAFPAFETELGWISMLVCYDQMWPEAAASCAMNGAQLICHPSAAVMKEHYMLQRAYDSQVHYISSSGTSSMISSPRAEILANGRDKDPAIVLADVDLKHATLGDPYFYEYLYSGIQDHKERDLKF